MQGRWLLPSLQHPSTAHGSLILLISDVNHVSPSRPVTAVQEIPPGPEDSKKLKVGNGISWGMWGAKVGGGAEMEMSSQAEMNDLGEHLRSRVREGRVLGLLCSVLSVTGPWTHLKSTGSSCTRVALCPCTHKELPAHQERPASVSWIPEAHLGDKAGFAPATPHNDTDAQGSRPSPVANGGALSKICILAGQGVWESCVTSGTW